MDNDRHFIDNPLRITCADALELVTMFLDDALAEPDVTQFRAHLTLCEACRVYVDQVRRTITISSASRDHDVEVQPANFDQLVAELNRGLTS